MTYGGIFPIAVISENAVCYHCGKSSPAPNHSAEAMKSYFHADCVPDFLKTKKGISFIAEGYQAYIDAGGILLKLA